MQKDLDRFVGDLSLPNVRLTGQIYPGCMVFTTPASHRFSAISFTVFPGNVGDEKYPANVYDRLKDVQEVL